MKRNVLALALFGVLACLCLSDIPPTAMRSRVVPAPDHSTYDAQNQQDGTFPSVDWGWWQSINPDLVGWITIPGTNIDGPIVHAAREAPDFYLDHDVYRNPDCYGCLYLDADCPPLSASAETIAHESTPNLTTSINRLICGHNPGFGNRLQFADLVGFSDASFAAEHQTILLQTPEARRTLQVACVTVEAYGGASNRTSFAHAREFRAWWNGVFAAATTRTETDIPAATQVFTFCTCSYNGDDERTLVFAYDPEEPQATS